MFCELSQECSGRTVIYHSGLNGTSLYHCPDLDIYLAGTLNQIGSFQRFGTIEGEGANGMCVVVV